MGVMRVRRLVRSRLSAGFNEGARLLWVALLRAGTTQIEFAKRHGVDQAQFVKMLYGDRKPGRQVANRLALNLGISPMAWDEPPKEPFAPPGASAA